MPEMGAIRRFTEVDSTNRVAVDLALEGAADGLVVVADHQTAGRGRLGRRWEASPGSALLVSILLRRALEPHWCVVAVALAATDACQDVGGFRPGLKWPNDLIAGERKLGGILAEVPAPGAVVVGLGLNLVTPPVPDAVGANELAGHPVERDALLDRVLEHLWPRLDDPDLVARYRRDCVTLGRAVRVDLGSEVLNGIATNITDEGHLLVDAAGVMHEVSAGDVVHVRNASRTAED